jgi:hypothetical protein
MGEEERVGLCATCAWVRVVTNRRGSTFYRCARAETDRAYPRYPALPRLECEGFDPSPVPLPPSPTS